MLRTIEYSLLILCAALLCAAMFVPLFVMRSVNAQQQNFPGSGGASIVSDLTVLPNASHLMAWYKVLPTESASAIVDYSGKGRTGIGPNGTAPTIQSVFGGIQCNNAGGVNVPAALNSAKTIVLYIQAGAQTAQNRGLVTGTGATWAALNLQTGGANSNQLEAQSVDSTSGRSTTRYSMWGTGTQALVMDTNNRHYQNGIEYTGNYFSNINGSSAGVQQAGNYSLCGFPQSTSSGYSNTGIIIYEAAFYDDVESAANIAAIDQVMGNVETSMGVYRTLFNNTLDTSNQILGTADSIGAGAGITQAVFNTTGAVGSIVLDDTWVQTNLATSGFTLQNLTQSVPSFIGQLRPQAVQNIHVVWGATNDIVTNGSTAAATLGYAANMCRQTRAAVTSAKCLVVDMMDVTGSDAGKNNYDTLFRARCWSFADMCVDLGSDPVMGADGAGATASVFQDGKHPTQDGSYNHINPMIQRAVNRTYACQDFSCASVYNSAAAAASAVTASSESTNTMTFTTALNPPLGSQVTCTGITPAGYNSGNSGWYVITTSGANFTAWSNTTGLGAGSVFGTCSVPMQKDKDVYSIINFGAGNYTLESCMGYTGGKIYIRNINAVASTLVGFASETITGGGATPTTLAGATTAILQAQLVSSAAGGCNWVRLQ